MWSPTRLQSFLHFFRRHVWDTYQHGLRPDDNEREVFIIAWKQCRICAKSKLIHLLQ